MNNPKNQAIDQTEASKYAEILSFEPADKVRFAVSKAKELLVGRTLDECIKIAEAIGRMRFTANFCESYNALPMISEQKLEQVWLLEGSALSLWMGCFNIHKLKVEKLELYEIFAVKVLILSQDYSRILTMTVENFGLPIDAMQLSFVKQRAASRMIDIVDCFTRAELLKTCGQINNSAKLLGSKGGRGRSVKIAPLEDAVIGLYQTHDFENMPVLKAANCIEILIANDKAELLSLTKNRNKVVVIQNIIRKYNKKISKCG